jgi:hypothetical protein
MPATPTRGARHPVDAPILQGASTLNYYVGIFGGGVARPMEDTGARRANHRRVPTMIRIAITQAAYDAIAATLPVGKRRLPAEVSANSDYLIGLNQRTV